MSTNWTQIAALWPSDKDKISVTGKIDTAFPFELQPGDGLMIVENPKPRDQRGEKEPSHYLRIGREQPSAMGASARKDDAFAAPKINTPAARVPASPNGETDDIPF